MKKYILFLTLPFSFIWWARSRSPAIFFRFYLRSFSSFFFLSGSNRYNCMAIGQKAGVCVWSNTKIAHTYSSIHPFLPAARVNVAYIGVWQTLHLYLINSKSNSRVCPMLILRPQNITFDRCWRWWWWVKARVLTSYSLLLTHTHTHSLQLKLLLRGVVISFFFYFVFAHDCSIHAGGVLDNTRWSCVSRVPCAVCVCVCVREERECECLYTQLKHT